MPTRLYRNAKLPAAAGFVWVHGGAFVFGDLDMPEAHEVGLALAARGVPVLSVDPTQQAFCGHQSSVSPHSCRESRKGSAQCPQLACTTLEGDPHDDS